MTDRYEVEKIAESIYVALVTKSKADPAEAAEQSFKLARDFVAYRDLDRQREMDERQAKAKAAQ